VYRYVRRDLYSCTEGECGGISFMAVGSLGEAIHSVGGVAPAGRRRAR